jgi:signal transduction histidine kinase
MGHVRDVGGERRPTDLHALLEQAVSSALARTDVRVERAYAEDLAPVDVAPGSLQRVFVNLLDNARWAAERKADGDGSTPTIRLSTEPFDGGVEIRVVDNGIGIPLADCARVFEPFFTTKPTGTGTGLGLSLAYDIVTEGHGGTLAALSREGEGATFVVTLPG